MSVHLPRRDEHDACQRRRGLRRVPLAQRQLPAGERCDDRHSGARDGADGWLARRSGVASAFGARFDMEIDALLIMALAVLAWQHGKAGGWVLLSGLLRYAFVGCGWFAPWLERPLPPSRRRQAVCVLQILVLCAVVSPAVAASWSGPLAAAALAALTGSFLLGIKKPQAGPAAGLEV